MLLPERTRLLFCICYPLWTLHARKVLEISLWTEGNGGDLYGTPIRKVVVVTELGSACLDTSYHDGTIILNCSSLGIFKAL